MTTPDAPNLKPADPLERFRDIIKLGKTEEEDLAYISAHGTLHVGKEQIVAAMRGTADISYEGEGRGISGELIWFYSIQLQNKTVRLRHINNGTDRWWDVDDAGMKADKHIESGLWTPGKNW